MSLKDLKDAPFHSWECLTILLPTQIEVNLVIKNEKAMECLLKVLIQGMETVDGKRGSGRKILNLMNKNFR